MAVKTSDDGVVIGLKFDVERLKQTLDQVKSMVQASSENAEKAVKKTDDALEKSRKNAEKWKIEPTTKGIEEAQKELDILNATIVNQQNELSNCEREHERLADKYGETSSQALKLEKRMLNLQASIEKNTKKSDDFGAALADAQDVMDAASGSAEDLEKNAKGAGKGMEDGGKGAKTFDIALGTLVGNALSAVVGKCAELLEQTKELRRDLSFLEQNAKDAGMGMEQLHNKAGELYAVTGDTNEVVEALSNILATGFNDADKAYEVIDMLAGAVVKFPETMKIESLADSLQETIATGEAVGQFSELLGRLGVDVDKIPGAGAAGGLGGAFLAFLNAELKPGIDLLLQTLKFSEKIKGADLIITGEGRTDRQSLMGKVPSGILEEAKRQGIPVIVVAGSIEDTEILNQAGFQGVFSIIPSPMSLETAMKPEVAKKNICRTVAQIISLVNL